MIKGVVVIQLQILVGLLMARFLYYRECSVAEAAVYCACSFMIGAYALMELHFQHKARQQALEPKEPEIDVDEMKDELDEIKTKVNGLTLRDGLKL